MDLSKVTDIVQLKAIAFDIMRERERLTSDLEKVTQRIVELEQQKAQPSEQKGWHAASEQEGKSV